MSNIFTCYHHHSVIGSLYLKKNIFISLERCLQITLNKNKMKRSTQILKDSKLKEYLLENESPGYVQILPSLNTRVNFFYVLLYHRPSSNWMSKQATFNIIKYFHFYLLYWINSNRNGINHSVYVCRYLLHAHACLRSIKNFDHKVNSCHECLKTMA